MSPTKPDPTTFSARLIAREAARLAALELSTTSPKGLEDALARISEEVTEEAKARLDIKPPPGSRPSTP